MSTTTQTSWTGLSGDWSDALIWSDGVPQNDGTAVQITVSLPGTITVAAGESFTVGDFNFVAGSALLDINGILTLAGPASSLAGTIGGAGAVFVGGGGSAVLAPGLVLNVATLAISNPNNYGDSGAVTLGGNLTDANTFIVNVHDFDTGGGGVLNLAGYTLSLTGYAGLYGTISGPGEILASGDGAIGSSVNSTDNLIGGGATIYVAGSLNQVGNIALGTTATDTADMIIGSHGTLSIYDDSNIRTDSTLSGGGLIINVGVIQKLGGVGDSVIGPTLINGGTIIDASGAMTETGLLINNGLIYVGSTDTAVAGGETFSAGNVTIDPSASGTFVIEQNDTLALSGSVGANQTISFASNGVYSYLGGGGVLQLSDVSQFNAPIANLGPSDTIEVTGSNIQYATYTDPSGSSPGKLLLYNTPTLSNGENPVAVLTLGGPTYPVGPKEYFDGGNVTIVIQRGPNLASTLSTDSWTAGSGNMSTDTNWSQGIAPDTAAVAAFGNGLNTDTVTISTLIAVNAIAAAPITFDQTGGVLGVENGGNIDGAYDQSGGILDIGGTLALNGGGTIENVQGLGEILFNGGNFVLGDSLTTPSFTLYSEIVGLGGSATLTPLGSESFNTHAEFNGGTIGGTGTLDLYGLSDLANVDVASGATLIDGNSGTMNLLGNVTLGSGSTSAVATMTIAQPATLAFLGDYQFAMNGSALLSNAGMIEKVGDGGAAQIAAPLINEAGATLDAVAGGLFLDGGGTLGGLLEGSGSIVLAGATFTLAAGATLNTGTIELAGVNPFDPSAELVLAGNQEFAGAFIGNGQFFYPVTVALGNYTATFAAADNRFGNMVFTDPGTVSVTGGGVINALSVNNDVVFVDGGSIDQTGNLYLGNASTDNSAISIATGGVYDLIGASEIQANGSVSLVNAGLLEGNIGSGSAIIQARISNSGAGTIAAIFGSLVAEGPVVNDGLITVAAGASLAMGGALSADIGQTGTLAISGGSVDLNGAVAADQTLVFGGSGGMVQIGDAGGFAGVIEGFGTADILQIDGLGVPNISYNSATSLLTLSGAGAITLDMPGLDITNLIAVTNASGTALEGPMPCFAEGTRLLGARGEIAVEELAVGDRLVLTNGGLAPVIWIGRRTIDLTRHPRAEAVMPVRIMAGAIGDGVPSRDLLLSPDHAVLLDGHLIPAKVLVNGTTIRSERKRYVSYYHVELVDHAVLMAEGLACESYLETGNRDAFENGGGAIALHPAFGPMDADWQAVRVQRSCAPLAEAGPIVERVRTRLLARAGLKLTSDPTLVGRREADGSVVIRSRSAVPGHVSPDPRDRRRLGVKIGAIVRADGRRVPLDHPGLTKGWHDPEPDGRWTDGDAVIPAALVGDGVPQLVVVASEVYLMPEVAGRAHAAL
ncbi:Hint domain-containing protein [Acidiphilium sp. MT5]